MTKSRCNLIRDENGVVTHRVCSVCKFVVNIRLFSKDNKSAAGGYQRTCNPCSAAAMRKRRAAGKERKETSLERLERVRKYRRDNPLQHAAHQAVAKAVKSGKLIPELCWCGKKGEAHHEDYNKPLEVEWMCRQHHMEHHAVKNEDQIPFVDWKLWGKAVPERRERSGNPDEINHPSYKIDVATADLIRERFALGARQADLMREFGLSRALIFNVVHDLSYKTKHSLKNTEFNPEDFPNA